MSIESGMPSIHLILCRPLLLPTSIFPSIRVFSNESVLHIRWPKFGVSASPSVLPMNIQEWFPLGWTGWISLLYQGTNLYLIMKRIYIYIYTHTHTHQVGRAFCFKIWGVFVCFGFNCSMVIEFITTIMHTYTHNLPISITILFWEKTGNLHCFGVRGVLISFLLWMLPICPWISSGFCCCYGVA